jgi:hypothetical protein
MIVSALRGLAEWKNYLRDVPELLEARESQLSALIGDLRDNDEYRYLEALSNQSKHRSIVEVSLRVSVDDTQRPHHYEFTRFTRGAKAYPAREILSFLTSEYTRQGGIVFAMFAALDELTKGSQGLTA